MRSVTSEADAPFNRAPSMRVLGGISSARTTARSAQIPHDSPPSLCLSAFVSLALFMVVASSDLLPGLLTFAVAAAGARSGPRAPVRAVAPLVLAQCAEDLSCSPSRRYRLLLHPLFHRRLPSFPARGDTTTEHDLRVSSDGGRACGPFT